jgi:formamidopyrimidine-DNA glycosylase
MVWHCGKLTRLTVQGGRHLAIAYAMTGSWSLWFSSFSRVAFDFDNGATLFFNDVRKFGRVTLKDAYARLEAVGPSMFQPRYDIDKLPDFQKRYGRRSLRWFLLDPWIAPGVGNYIVNEALWLAKLHPLCNVGCMPFADLQRVIEACRTVYRDSLKSGGVSVSDFVQMDGAKGSYQTQLKCYRKPKCERCDSAIERMADGDSGHYFCPICQPAPAIPAQ